MRRGRREERKWGGGEYLGGSTAACVWSVFWSSTSLFLAQATTALNVAGVGNKNCMIEHSARNSGGPKIRGVPSDQGTIWFGTIMRRHVIRRLIETRFTLTIRMRWADNAACVSAWTDQGTVRNMNADQKCSANREQQSFVIDQRLFWD